MSMATQEANIRAWRRPLTAFAYRNAVDLLPPETAMLAQLGGEVARGRVLDIGVGTGRTTGHLANRCAGYTGLDYSPEMIRRAKDRFPGLDLRVMDARDMSAFGRAAFDIVFFSFNGIDYVGHEDRLRILAQVHGVLKPGGAFLFSAHRLGAVIPPARALSNLALSVNPVRAANGLLKYAQGMRNARRLKPLERRGDHYALLNDSAQQYQLLTYYISPEAQQQQLVRAGFGHIRAYSQSGTALSFETPDRDDYMVHYLARGI